MIKKIYQVPVELHLLCDKCNTEMEFLGQTLLSDPPQFPHKCPKCEHIMVMDSQYPHIEYERKTLSNDLFSSMFN